jgi:hypothetical protein
MGRPNEYMPEPRLLTKEQARAYLGHIPEHQIDQLPIRPLKFGRNLRWDKKALDEWLDLERDGSAKSSPDYWLGKLDEGDRAGD